MAVTGPYMSLDVACKNSTLDMHVYSGKKEHFSKLLYNLPLLDNTQPILHSHMKLIGLNKEYTDSTWDKS